MTPDLTAWLDAVRHGASAASPRAGAFARHVHVLPTTGSTNDDVARAAAEGAPEGYVVIAAEQTAGRGRRGAAWHSPAAHGLYCSVLLRPARWPVVLAEPASPAPALVTLMAGVAVAHAVKDACGAAVELKWPNDVMVRDGATRWRKLAGILAEGASDGGVLRTVVLGIGINVRRAPAPADVAARMIALEDVSGTLQAGGPALVVDLVAALLARVRDGVARLSRGAMQEIRDEWVALAPTVRGTAVAWDLRERRCSGVARGIDESGALRVSTDEGRMEIVHGGDVTWMLDGARA